MPIFRNILLDAIPAFIILIILEIIYAIQTQRKLYEVKDAATSISLGLGNLFIGLLTKSCILVIFIGLYKYKLFNIPYNAWWAFILCFLADDFSYYWAHRSAHSIRWFWASHVVHHTSEKYNLAAALRQTWTGNLTGSFIFWTWMPLVGFHPAMVMLMQSVSLIYQFWIHTESVYKCPRWFEFIFNTPSHHRVHHGTDLDYLDTNYAGVLIIWDRMFGSFVSENQRPQYGLTKQIESYNPAKIAFYEWVQMVKDVANAKSMRGVLGYIFGPPGWSEDGSRLTVTQMREQQKK